MIKKKVLIVGGGPGGLSAAWHLSHGPRRDEIEVSAYTLGWRLGGKGATGRGPNSRIQEHGIHGFVGFYANSHELLRNAYLEVFPDPTISIPGRKNDANPVSGLPPGARATRIEEALIGDDYSVNFLFAGTKSVNRPFWLPHNDGKPWIDPLHPSRNEIIQSLITLASIALLRHPISSNSGQWRSVQKISAALAWLSKQVLVRRLSKLAVTLSQNHLEELEHHLSKLLTAALRWRLSFSNATESHFAEIDYFVAVLRGLLKAKVITVGPNARLDVDALDAIDYKTWLRENGIQEATLKTGLPHTPAFICFQFPQGDSTLNPAMSAAAYLGWMVRLALGKGSAYSFFRSGTGETVIDPLFRSCQKAGVQFTFFHKLSRIVPSADGTSIEQLVFRRQARLCNESEPYEPMTTVDGVAYDVWPSEPKWELLNSQDAESIRFLNADLESYWSSWLGVDDVVLERGKDFDEIILAVPPTVFPYACLELLKHSEVLRRATNLESCATVGVQLWLDQSMAELGLDQKISEGRTVGGSYVDPFNGIGDFSDLIAHENWGASPPKTLLYLCGPIADRTDPLKHDFSDHRIPMIERERALAITSQYLQTAALWLPNAAGDRPADNLGLDVNLLRTSDPDLAGMNRLSDQFLKVNIDPSERYILSLPGSAAKRPKAWEAEATNLTLAGDWIYTGINIGSFEGAVTGGMLAAHAVTGFPALHDIAGYDLLHPGISDVIVIPRLDTCCGPANLLLETHSDEPPPDQPLIANAKSQLTNGVKVSGTGPVRKSTFEPVPTAVAAASEQAIPEPGQDWT